VMSALTRIESKQHQQLEALIAAANKALPYAATGDLFGSRAGIALVNAMHDLTGCDELYRWAGDLCHEQRISRDGISLDDQGDEVFEVAA